ncbi:MAG: hypothetical protein EOM54_10440 [Clostridia bacterium]|nr:hypothetical protein [Clostridia bacterium]
MADRNDTVIIELAGEPWELVFGHKAIKKMEQMLGINVEEFSLDKLSMEDIEKVMWCALQSDAREKGKAIELSEMEDLLDTVRPYSLVIQKMTEAVMAAFPEIDPNAMGAAKNGAGKTATGSPPVSGSRTKNTKK